MEPLCPGVVKRRVFAGDSEQHIKTCHIMRGVLGIGLKGGSRLIAFLAVSASQVIGQGIPEPDLVLYGTVVNVRNNANIPLGYGPLTWIFQPLAGGAAITASGTLTNIDDELSYILRIPCETAVSGFSISPNTIPLTAVGTSFDRSQVTWYSNLLSFANPTLTNTIISTIDRGRIERIDLVLSAPIVFDGNGLPVDWEMYYFGRTGIDPQADPDGDGLSNLAEYLAGTDPTSFTLRLSGIHTGQGTIILEWPSVTNQVYVVQRATDLAAGFVDITVGLPGTPPLNSFTDINPFKEGPAFYRLRLGP